MGVVKDGARCDRNHRARGSEVGWFMHTAAGSLFGHGKFLSDGAGRVKDGQVVTMQVDLGAGTLKFWKDGKPHGPGFTSVEGPLRWAVCAFSAGASFQIVQTSFDTRAEPMDNKNKISRFFATCV